MQNYENFNSKTCDWDTYKAIIDKKAKEVINLAEYSTSLQNIYLLHNLQVFLSNQKINAVTKCNIFSVVLRCDKAYFQQYCFTILSFYEKTDTEIISNYYRLKLLENMSCLLSDYKQDIPKETFQSLLEKNQRLQEEYRRNLPFYCYQQRLY
jgi:hypothetical protein